MIIVSIGWKQRPAYIKMLGAYGGVSLIALILQFAMILFFHVPRGNNFVYNCYSPFEVVFLMSIFYIVFDSRKTKRIILISNIIFFLIWLAEVGYHDFWSLNSYARSVGNILLIGVSITYFYTLMRDLPSQGIFRLPMFWMATGLLVYNAGTFILFVLLEYLVKVLNNDLIYYWTFQTFLRMVFNSFLIVCVWQDLRNRRQS